MTFTPKSTGAPFLGGVAQDPADCLADEELALVEHRVGVGRETLEVAVTAS